MKEANFLIETILIIKLKICYDSIHNEGKYNNLK